MSNQNPIIGRRMLHHGKVVTVVGAPGFQPALSDMDAVHFYVPCLDVDGAGMVAVLEDMKALPTETETQPEVVNAGIIGAGAHEWPGPWVRDSDGDWSRGWPSGCQAVSNRVRRPDGAPIAVLNDWPRTAADARKGDAILAIICRGPDPHPYPDALLATGGSDD